MYTNFLILITAITTFFSLTMETLSKDDLKLLKDVTFSVQSGGKLSLNTPVGTIKISSSDKNEATFKVYGNESAENKLDFDIVQSGNDINIKANQKKDADKNGGYNLKYEITLPREYNLETNTKGGNVDVNDIKGKIQVNTMGGNITSEKNEGELDLNTMGGNIKISANSSKLKANTMGGNIMLDFSGINNGIDLNTMGGNIHVTLPSDINGDADFSTAAGKITCDFAAPEKNLVSSSLKAKFNSGGEAISINTAAGNISVVKK